MKRFIQKGIETIKGIEERSRQREAARVAGELAAAQARREAEREEAEKRREEKSLEAAPRLMEFKDRFVVMTNAAGAPDTPEDREDFYRPLAQAIHNKLPDATKLTTSYFVGFRSNSVRTLQKGIGIVGEELGEIADAQIEISDDAYNVGRTAGYDDLLHAVEQSPGDDAPEKTAHIVVISASVIEGINLQYGPATGGVAFAPAEIGESGHIQWEKLSESRLGYEDPHNINS